MTGKKSIFKSRTVISAILGAVASIIIFAQKAVDERATFDDVSALVTTVISAAAVVKYRLDAHDELFTPKGLPGPDPDAE